MLVGPTRRGLASSRPLPASRDSQPVMPITIDAQSEPRLGPGSFFTLTTDFVGPIPLEWRWQLTILADDEGAAYVTSAPSNGTHSISGILATPGGGWSLTHTPGVFPNNGAELTVQLELLDEGFEVQDDGESTVLTWTTQGDFQRQINTPGGAGEGLTDTQAVQLASIPTAVTATFLGTLGEAILRGVGDLILHPPISFLIEDGDPLTLTGRGSLTRPSGPIEVNAFGATLSFFTIPAGFGFRDGNVLEYHERIVQLATTHELANGSREVLTEVLDLNTDGFMWLWRNALPNRILYDVTPGCVVILRWLGATIPT